MKFYSGNIIGLIIAIVMIIGGLSGGLVLRGTNSSGLLVIVGLGFAAYELYRAWRNGQDEE